jgi:hypothetical protein
MATKKSEGHKDWIDFYSAKGLFDEPLDANDKVTLSCLLNGKGLLDATTTYPFNWIIVPGAAKTVRLFHHYFKSGGRLLGINGCSA